jgi:hypothetical protein
MLVPKLILSHSPGSFQHWCVELKNSRTLSGCFNHTDLLILGNARVAGLQKELGMTDRQYQICVTVLFA